MKRVLAAALVVTAAVAAADTPAPEPTLHEYVAPPHENGGDRIIDLPRAPTPSGPSKPGAPPPKPDNPLAIRDGSNRLLVQPPVSPDQQVGEPVLGDVAMDRDTKVDYETQADSTLHYREVFNPSVVPFKRLTSLNAVRSDYTMVIQGIDDSPITVGGEQSPDRDLFWGSIMVHLGSGTRVAIPSVAPDMRVLSYEADPPVRLQFSKDGADNYYVRDLDAHEDGEVRIVFLVDAPQSYFAPSVPRNYTLRDLRELRRAETLPNRAASEAEEIIDHIGIRRDGPVDEAVDRLVEYFRNFQAGEQPEPTGDIYRDLALSQRGVCRHRAFAFMVTANALGIPTHYVENEAHAFTEIWVPERGWLRIDLGGAADTLDVANETDKAMYRPRGEDPFPKPPAYRDNYTKLRGDVRGLSDDQLDDAQRPLDANGREPGSDGMPIPAPGRSLPRPPANALAGKLPSTIVVDRADSSGFRGETITVTGHVRAGDQPAPNLRVEIYLVPEESNGENARDVGETMTDETGAFTATVTLPRDVPLARNLVYAATPGDARIAPALSD